MPDEALPELIRTLHQALATAGVAPVEAKPGRPESAVPVKRSVFPDHIICLEDSKSFKTLKRHLQNVYGMTPDQHRQRWGCWRATRWWRQPMPSIAPSWPSRSGSEERQPSL